MRAEPLFEVVDGGILTTVQDAGRTGWAHLGVPESGAADPWSLAVANLLLGNDAGAAVLESTIAGPTLRALRPVTIALAGADLGGAIGARRARPDRTHRLAAGDVLELPGGSGRGCREYLAVPGGFDVPVLLGSRSTCLPGAFGGHQGRALRSRDVLMAGAPRGAPPASGSWPEGERARFDASNGPAITTLRVVAGPADGLDALVAAPWRVSSASDRVGTRLEGVPAEGVGGEATTHGVPWGAIQIPPDGRPIVLGPDHQTTGGYRVAAVVISADRPVLGQLPPGAGVAFAVTTPDAAVEALRAQRAALSAGAGAIRDAAGWDALAEAAGA